MSRRDRFGKIIQTGSWTPAQMAEGHELLATLLEGVGDPLRERSFRMCVTLCRHRALSVREYDNLPPSWFEEPAIDLAGAPVELLWTKGIPDRLSSHPCRNPTWQRIGDWTENLRVPLDCEKCGTCLARLAIRESCSIPERKTHA